MRDPAKRRFLWGYRLISAAAATGAAPTLNQGSSSNGDPLELFAKLMPVYTHPRCANCHGGVDPFNKYKGPPAVEHGGDVIGDPKDPLEVRNEECGDCHDQTDEIKNSWILASKSDQIEILSVRARSKCARSKPSK